MFLGDITFALSTIPRALDVTRLVPWHYSSCPRCNSCSSAPFLTPAAPFLMPTAPSFSFLAPRKIPVIPWCHSLRPQRVSRSLTPILAPSVPCLSFLAPSLLFLMPVAPSVAFIGWLLGGDGACFLCVVLGFLISWQRCKAVLAFFGYWMLREVLPFFCSLRCFCFLLRNED